MNGIGVKAFGRIEFELIIGSQNIDRADLGNHVGRDQTHDLVQPILRIGWLGHRFPKASQQYARPHHISPH